MMMTKIDADQNSEWSMIKVQYRVVFDWGDIYVTIGNPAFCLFLYLTGALCRSELQHVGDVSEKKLKYWPIRTWEIGGVRL